MWASITPSVRPGEKWDIYLIDRSRESVARPFARTIRVKVTQVPIGRGKGKP